MTKLYFNDEQKIALLINETNKTYQIIKGTIKSALNVLFSYKASARRLKELYQRVKGTYQRA